MTMARMPGWSATRRRRASEAGARRVAPTPVLDAHQVAAWRRAVVANGVTDEDLAAADRRMAADICAPVEPQLAWLREAGFVEVDAPFRDGRFAVLTGRLPH